VKKGLHWFGYDLPIVTYPPWRKATVVFFSRRLQMLQGHDKIDVRSDIVGKRALVLG